MEKSWDDPTLTEDEVYQWGRQEAMEVIEEGRVLDSGDTIPWGMTWDEPEKQHFNVAYDRGARDVFKEWVHARFSTAQAIVTLEGKWTIEVDRRLILSEPQDSVDTAWEDAAKNVSRIKVSEV